MYCGDYYAGYRAQIAHRKAEYRHGAQRLEQAGLYTLRAQNQSGLLRKLGREAARIVRNDHAAARVLRVLVDVVGQTQRSAAHIVRIHAVKSRADNAAHTRGAKLQLGVKPVLYLALVALERFQLVNRRLIIGELGQPLLILRPVIHLL